VADTSKLELKALDLLKQGDLSGAHRALLEILSIRPNDQALKNRIAQVEHIMAQRQQSQQKMHQEPLRYAVAYIKAGRLTEGLQLLRDALARDPTNVKLRELALEVARKLQSEVAARPGPIPTPAPQMQLPGADPLRAKREAEERARREAEARQRRDYEDRARREAEERAKREAEDRARREAEDWARREAAERAKKEAAERIRKEAEDRVRREAEDRMRREADERARREAEERSKREAEARIKREAEERVRREAEAKAKREAEERARREAEERARREAEERARREADERARREAEERARREAEERARKDAELRARSRPLGPPSVGPRSGEAVPPMDANRARPTARDAGPARPSVSNGKIALLQTFLKRIEERRRRF
jgi:hypothetical protein